jgi:hypothetical protein
LKDTWAKKNIFAKFNSIINRQDFNISWNKTITGNKFLISDNINIFGNIQLQPANNRTSSSKHLIPDNSSIRIREKIHRGEISKVEISKLKYVNPIPLKTRDSSKLTKKSQESQTLELQNKKQVSFSSLLYIGALAFFAIIYLSILFKMWLAVRFKEVYKETNFYGISSDILCMLFIYLFSVSFYEIGWN